MSKDINNLTYKEALAVAINKLSSIDNRNYGNTIDRMCELYQMDDLLEMLEESRENVVGKSNN